MARSRKKTLSLEHVSPAQRKVDCHRIRRIALPAVGALLALAPIATSAQQAGTSLQGTGFYVGLESGLNWLLNSNGNSNQTGYAVGGVAGFDFFGPRLELEVMYRNNAGNGPAPFAPGGWATGQTNQLSTMVNGLYDFRPGAMITPYAGAGVGLAFVDPSLGGGCTMCSTNFAYQAILGVGYNASPSMRVNLDARYYGTTNPGSYTNNDISVMLGATYRFGKP
jgi:opacity protein-like surface antigen